MHIVTGCPLSRRLKQPNSGTERTAVRLAERRIHGNLDKPCPRRELSRYTPFAEVCPSDPIGRRAAYTGARRNQAQYQLRHHAAMATAGLEPERGDLHGGAESFCGCRGVHRGRYRARCPPPSWRGRRWRRGRALRCFRGRRGRAGRSVHVRRRGGAAGGDELTAVGYLWTFQGRSRAPRWTPRRPQRFSAHPCKSHPFWFKLRPVVMAA